MIILNQKFRPFFEIRESVLWIVVVGDENVVVLGQILGQTLGKRRVRKNLETYEMIHQMSP